ncbi:MAG: SMP-30/gluconolactonase/LRE family protein [Verrucomicrobia subdivision 3 bacterium]|nr:SMP-30/gluconolactonase/LRE family protein [Limisphaerales bacterium]
MNRKFTFALRSALSIGLLTATACNTPDSSPDAATKNEAVLSETLHPSIGTIERLDPALDKLIARDAKIEQLADAFDWVEGPVWVRTKQGQEFLLFSDIPLNKIYKWNEQSGLEEYLHPSGYTGLVQRVGELGSNGLMLDPAGRLVLCQHGDRRIARLTNSLNNPNPEYETLADTYEGKRFNSPNDGCFNQAGDLYFTDPPYGLPKALKDPAKELAFQGVFRLDKSGKVTLLTDTIQFPNGIAFSPDESILYIAESGPQTRIHAFDVKNDGTVENRRIFFDPAGLRAAGARGSCDGLKLDQHGNLFATGPGGVLIISPTGKHLGTLATGTRIANVAWGNDGSILYLTANSYLCRIRTKTKGVGF